MASSTIGNVIKLTADNDSWPRAGRTEAILVAAGGGGYTIELRQQSQAGPIMFEANIAASQTVEFSIPLVWDDEGLFLNVTAGAGTVYLYSC